MRALVYILPLHLIHTIFQIILVNPYIFSNIWPLLSVQLIFNGARVLNSNITKRLSVEVCVWGGLIWERKEKNVAFMALILL